MIIHRDNSSTIGRTQGSPLRGIGSIVGANLVFALSLAIYTYKEIRRGN